MQQREQHRQRLDPVDHRTTSALLAVLLGFIGGISAWSVIWPWYTERARPPDDENWPTAGVVAVSLLILAGLIALLILVLFLVFQRLRRRIPKDA